MKAAARGAGEVARQVGVCVCVFGVFAGGNDPAAGNLVMQERELRGDTPMAQPPVCRGILKLPAPAQTPLPRPQSQTSASDSGAQGFPHHAAPRGDFLLPTQKELHAGGQAQFQCRLPCLPPPLHPLSPEDSVILCAQRQPGSKPLLPSWATVGVGEVLPVGWGAEPGSTPQAESNSCPSDAHFHFPGNHCAFSKERLPHV